MGMDKGWETQRSEIIYRLHKLDRKVGEREFRFSSCSLSVLFMYFCSVYIH